MLAPHFVLDVSARWSLAQDRVVSWGTNAKLSEVHASLALRHLKCVRKTVGHYRGLAHCYSRALAHERLVADDSSASLPPPPLDDEARGGGDKDSNDDASDSGCGNAQPGDVTDTALAVDGSGLALWNHAQVRRGTVLISYEASNGRELLIS